MEYVELEVWKESRSLVNSVCKATMQLPIESVYKLTSWLRRCAVSVPSNITEEYGRRTFNGAIQFSHISRGSIYELETQLYLALDQKYLMQTDFDSLKSQIKKCKKLINEFINYYKSRSK